MFFIGTWALKGKEGNYSLILDKGESSISFHLLDEEYDYIHTFLSKRNNEYSFVKYTEEKQKVFISLEGNGRGNWEVLEKEELEV